MINLFCYVNHLILSESMKKIIKLFFVLIFLLIGNSKLSFGENKNEILIGVAIGSGFMENVKGMHTAVTGNLGTNIKSITLTDDNLNTDYSFSLDYNRNLFKKIFLNTGISYANISTSATDITFIGGFNSGFPDIDFKGFIFDLGPSYRFQSRKNLTPFIGIQATYFRGKQTDTNYPTISGKGLYGEGGKETDVDCRGITPNFGMYANSGLLKGFGITIDNVILSCENDAQRSYTEGYEADFNLINYRIDYRVLF